MCVSQPAQLNELCRAVGVLYWLPQGVWDGLGDLMALGVEWIIGQWVAGEVGRMGRLALHGGRCRCGWVLLVPVLRFRTWYPSPSSSIHSSLPTSSTPPPLSSLLLICQEAAMSGHCIPLQ